MTLIIGIGHRRRMGKDAFGSFLSEALQARGKRVEKRGFADRLKDACHLIYGYAGVKDRRYYDEFPEKREVTLPAIGMSPRELWIKFGTNAVRHHVYDNTWVDCLIHETSECDIRIITDVRFPNEAVAIRQAGGKLVRVTRPGVPVHSDVADSALAFFDEWDFDVNNCEDLTHLRYAASQLADQVVKSPVKVSDR